jgi:SAM-dependent methyltransferase
VTGLDQLPLISHCCFNGNRDFRSDFRVLVAGGGTGDAAIYLAEQLRDTSAEIVYLDISTASLGIAKERASVRKLNNIRWINDSILNIPSLQLGMFDYINCSGVLHHLKSPSEGMRCLRDALNENGAMGIMVYAKYGRTGIYQIQELMRLVNHDELDDKVKVNNTKVILDELPDSNWFSMGRHLTSDHTRYGDIGIYDLFLHSQDRAYTVPELYEWLDSQSLKLHTFARDKTKYLPEAYISNPDLLEKIKRYSKQDQQAIAELMCGNIMKHAFYCSKGLTSEPNIQDSNWIPFLWGGEGNHMSYYQKLHGMSDSGALVIKADSIEFQIQRSQLALLVFKHMDGVKTVEEMANHIADALPTMNKTIIIGGIRQLYEMLHFAGIAYLRHKSIPMYLDSAQLQQRAVRYMS